MRDTSVVALGRRGGDTLAKTAPAPAVQQFSCLEKAGGRVEHLGRIPKKNHPVQIVRKMPLACDNQRARKKDTTLYFRSKTFVKTISSRSLVRPVPVGIRRSVRYVFIYFLRAAEGELQLLLPRAET